MIGEPALPPDAKDVTSIQLRLRRIVEMCDLRVRVYYLERMEGPSVHIRIWDPETKLMQEMAVPGRDIECLAAWEQIQDRVWDVIDALYDKKPENQRQFP